MAKKEKKEKVRYYDDGRSIADMSGVSGRRLPSRNPYRSSSTAKEKWDTYWNAVKMMIGPMLVVIVGLCIVYMVLYLIFLLA